MIHLSSYILFFEVLTIPVMPVLLYGCRRSPRFLLLAKIWASALVLALTLQIIFVGWKRHISVSAAWSLTRPSGMAQAPVPPRWNNGAPPVYFSRPAMREMFSGHSCYDVYYSKKLADWLQVRGKEPVRMSYTLIYRFDTLIGSGDVEIEGFGSNFKWQETTGQDFWGDERTYWCFPPGSRLFQ